MSSPWPKGKTSDSSTFVIETHIKVDSKGRVQTFRTLQDSEDEKIVATLPNHGLEYASFGLIQESMRQEALFQGLLLLSEGKPLSQEVLERSLTETFFRLWKTMAPDVVNFTLESLK